MQKFISHYFISSITLKIGVIVSIVCLSNACNHRYYAPNTISIPHLQQQHDASISGGFSSGSEYTGYEAQIAYSPMKHVMVLGNYFSAKNNKTINSVDDQPYGKGNFIEFGVGGYKLINERTVFNAATGYGRGKTYNYFGQNKSAELFFERIFWQFGYSSRYRVLQTGLGLRINYLNFYKGTVDFQINQNDRAIIQRLQQDTPLWLAEYSFKFGWHWNGFVINNELTYSPSRQVQKDARFAASNFHVGLGLDIHTLLKKLKKQVEN